MPTIALIAHDGKKDDMMHFTSSRRALLSQFHLIATGATGARVAQTTGLPVERMLRSLQPHTHQRHKGLRIQPDL